MSRTPLCQVSDVPVGTGKEFVAADRIIALFNVDGQFMAMDGICPHAGGPLANGCLTGTVVTCPWHGWQFDLQNGQHQLTPRIRQQCFSVIVEDGTVWLENSSAAPGTP